MDYLTLVPAYNRDYQTSAQVLEGWNADKDFRIMDISCPFDGKYLNRSQVERTPSLANTVFRIRYKQRMNIVMVQFVDGKWTGEGDDEEEGE
jgi:hypothetical protein